MAVITTDFGKRGNSYSLGDELMTLSQRVISQWLMTLKQNKDYVEKICVQFEGSNPTNYLTINITLVDPVIEFNGRSILDENRPRLSGRVVIHLYHRSDFKRVLKSIPGELTTKFVELFQNRAKMLKENLQEIEEVLTSISTTKGANRARKQ